MGRGSWVRQAMTGAGMCETVSREDEAQLEEGGENRRRSEVEPGLGKSRPPLGLLVLIRGECVTMPASLWCCSGH